MLLLSDLELFFELLCKVFRYHIGPFDNWEWNTRKIRDVSAE